MDRTIESPVEDFTQQMKRDWNERAKEDARWFINSVRHGQTEGEFDESGRKDIEGLVRGELPMLVDYRDPASMRALEIGCGIGRLTKHLAGIFGEVYGADVSSEMIQQGRERLRSHRNIHLRETSGSDFAEFPDEYFDFIFSALVFQHVPTKEIILSNIRDAYRVLKPGCIFKFSVRSVMNDELMRIQKDTWIGASLSEEEIRELARDLGARLIGLNGGGTLYCWTLLRKPRRDVKRELRKPPIPPSINYIGRSDNMHIKEIPARGEQACVGLISTGLERDEVDINSLVIKLRDKDITPCYVGSSGDGSTPDVQVNFRIPEDDPGGNASVRLQKIDGEASEAVTIKILPPRPVPPKIHYITNAVDEGLDVFTRGPKSIIRVLTEGLNNQSNSENVRVRVGGNILKPESIIFLPDGGFWRVTAHLPESIVSGETRLQVIFNGLESDVAPLLIREAEPAAAPAPKEEPQTLRSFFRSLFK
jgi:SAM-dependent methyltransferase